METTPPTSTHTTHASERGPSVSAYARPTPASSHRPEPELHGESGHIVLGLRGPRLIVMLLVFFIAGFALRHFFIGNEATAERNAGQTNDVITRLDEALRVATNTTFFNPAALAVQSSPNVVPIIGHVEDKNGERVTNALVRLQGREVRVSEHGYFLIPLVNTNQARLEVTAPDYYVWRTNIATSSPSVTVVLKR